MSEVVFDNLEVQEVLSHRYPFLLVDKIVEFVPGDRIVGIKNVTINEPFFQGHFPGNHVMPGVLIMEALAQTSAILSIKSKPAGKLGEGEEIYLVGSKNFKWKRKVVPGDVLRLEVIFRKKKKTLWMVDVCAKVGDEIAAEGSLSAIES